MALHQLPLLERPTGRPVYCLPNEAQYQPDDNVGIEVDETYMVACTAVETLHLSFWRYRGKRPRDI